MNGKDMQVEEGNYARIHNGILEALSKGGFTAGEYACLLVLLRQTYGWGKKDDSISYGQLADATGLTRRSVIRSMQSLEKKNVVLRVKSSNHSAQTWRFNKYAERWRSDVGVTPKLVTHVSPPGDVDVTPTSDARVTHKRKERQTTTTTRDDGGFRTAIKAYEQNVGLLTPMLAEQISSLMEDYPTEWFVEAVGIAVEREARNLSYIKGILRRWRREGKSDSAKKSKQPTVVGIDLKGVEL